ncbi:MAG TPA: MBL fold metallo-hydrolase [Acidobacteriota bacterium]|nr:MBL fold metallo-hydrolase [Acidobacteriota bacterium]
MGYEIDFLAVGEGERSGDAIALRFGDLLADPPNQRVIIIDGGTADSGRALVDHIRKHYRTDNLDLVVSTHPDADHCSGLKVVLEELQVSCLLMHRPWEHADNLRRLFSSPRLTIGGLERIIEKSLTSAHQLEEIAIRKNIKVHEPFTGLSAFNGAIRILGPTAEYYESLVPNFRSTPAAATPRPSILQRTLQIAEEAVTWVAETLHHETLTDDGVTSAENDSSAIVHLQIDGASILFTGDAGITALTAAHSHAAHVGIDLSDLTLFQAPHHGSKRNVGPSILNKIKAPRAYISAAKNGSPSHPAKKVVNALIRRESRVFATQGEGLRHCHNAPDRVGWVPATELTFSSQVEE